MLRQKLIFSKINHISKSASRYLKYSADKRAGLYSYQKKQNNRLGLHPAAHKLGKRKQNKCLEYFERLVQVCTWIDHHKLVKLKRADYMLSNIYNTGINREIREKLSNLHVEIKKLIDSY